MRLRRLQGHFLAGLVVLEGKDRKTALRAFKGIQPRH